jgi:hypothetical protein
MKLQEIIDRIDKSENESEYSISNDLYDELELEQQYDNAHRLTSYFFGSHLCTDTHVGYKAYFLDDVFVCYSKQTCRRGSEFFYWKDIESKNNVRDYLLSLQIKSVDDGKYNICDMEEDFGDGYGLVEYRGQFIGGNLLIDTRTGSIVENLSYDKRTILSVDEHHPLSKLYEEKLIEIKHSDGTTEIVDCKILLSPYKIK